MTVLEIEQFICRSDNFGVLIHDPASGATASIDAPDAVPIRNLLAQRGWSLTHILTTHHHSDHTAGHTVLKAETGCEIFGPAKEAPNIPGIGHLLKQGDVVRFGAHDIHVLETPGHTLDHLTYWIPSQKLCFAGDTLFSLGCGRLLEGTASMMWASLQKLMALPSDTMIYCGHEYTEANAAFAVTVEPDNPVLRQRQRDVQALRNHGRMTVPVTLGLEQETNPFLRPMIRSVQEYAGMAGAPEAAVFAELRRRKDIFQ